MRTARNGEPIRSLIAFGIFLISTSALYAQSLPAVCFKSLSDYSIPTVNTPYSASVGDVNGDGRKDIAVSNIGDGTLKVLFGAPDRRFVDGPIIAVGPNPRVVLATDVDGDGDLDLATLRPGILIISLNDGQGAFNNVESGPLGNHSKMVSADLNLDGKMDLITSGAGGLATHFSNGDGTFFVNLQTLTLNPTNSLKSFDLNNDGIKDLAFGEGNVVKMYAGDGHGNLIFADSETVPAVIYDLGVGDVNDDGKADILVIANGPYLIAGDGAGNFASWEDFPHWLAYTPTITDIDNDGVNDIAIANSESSSVQVYYGQGGGTYDNPKSYLATGYELTVEDLDNDGMKDLVVVDLEEATGGVSVLFAQNNSFETMKGWYIDHQITDALTGDFNGDGRSDIVTHALGKFYIFKNSVNGYSSPEVYDAPEFIGSMDKGDFDGDGDVDLVLMLLGKVNVWLNDGDGTFTDDDSFTVTATSGDMTVADFNGDEKLDLAVLNIPGDNVAIMLGDGTGAFSAQPSPIPAVDFPISIASADLNNDDLIDLVVGSWTTNRIAVILGNGSASFLSPIEIAGGHLINNHVSLADLNNDGLPEIITLGLEGTSDDRGYVAVRRNLGNGFAAPVEYECAGGQKKMAFGDFNGDNKIDIAVAGYEKETMGILLGKGDGTFDQKPFLFSTGYGLTSVADDLNGDGSIDLIGASAYRTTLMILENTTAHAVATGPTTFCTGSVTLNANPNAMVYEWSGGPNTSSTNSMIASKRGVYSVTTSNFSGRCSTTSSVTVNGPPQDPDLQISDPTCTDANGSISVLIQDDDDEYSFDNGINYQTSNTKGPLTQGTYNIIIKSDAGCLSETVQASIGAPPPIPTAAQAQSTDPTCESITGSINITVLAATDTYSIDDGINFTSDHIVTGLTAGVYPVVVMNQEGCMSPSVELIINEGPPIPASLSMQTTDPTCTAATGSISVNAQSEGETYSFDNGETFQSSNTIEGLASGTYLVLIKNEVGCKSEATETVIYPRPLVPTTPVAQITHPTCSEATGSISVVIQSEGEEYSFDNGTNFQSNKQKTSVVPGAYSIVIRSEEGCTSVVSTATVKPQPATPGKPEVTATTQSNGDVLLQAPASASEYHWLKDGTPITSATVSSYKATVSGSYSVLIVSTDGCSSKPSDPLAVVVVGDIYEGGSVASRSYPNPATTTLYYSVEASDVSGTIYNTSGAEIHVTTVRTGDQLIFDVTGLSPGLYLLKVEEEGTVKTVRWVKQ